MPKLNNATRLCFGVAVAGLFVGVPGAIVNVFAPQTTTLDSVLVVAVLYGVMGGMKLLTDCSAITTDRLGDHPGREREATGDESCHTVETGSLKRAA